MESSHAAAQRRDGFQCVRCGVSNRKAKLEVHHRTETRSTTSYRTSRRCVSATTARRGGTLIARPRACPPPPSFSRRKRDEPQRRRKLGLDRLTGLEVVCTAEQISSRLLPHRASVRMIYAHNTRPRIRGFLGVWSVCVVGQRSDGRAGRSRPFPLRPARRGLSRAPQRVQ